MAQDTVSAAPRDSSARGDSTAGRSSDTLGVPRAPGRIDCARPPLARRTSCRRERKCGKHRQARAVQRTTINMTISLAFLAPDLVRAAIEGRLPRGIGVTRLRDAPAEWSRQHAMLSLIH